VRRIARTCHIAYHGPTVEGRRGERGAVHRADDAECCPSVVRLKSGSSIVKLAIGNQPSIGGDGIGHDDKPDAEGENRAVDRARDR